MKGHRWKEEEISYLKENYYKIPVKDIATELGLRYQQIVSKASRLGMNKKKSAGEYWSSKEDEFLKENFEYASKEFIERGLPERSWNGIYLRGNKTLKLERKSQDKYYIDHLSFSNWNEQVSYIAGFIMADGYIKYEKGDRNENSLQFELADYDIDILQKIKSYTKFEGPIRRTKRSTVKLDISNKLIIESLIEMGIPSQQKTFSANWVIGIPKDLMNHFVRGVFDGDGSIYSKNKKMAIQFLGTKNLLENILKVIPAKEKAIYFRGKDGKSNVYAIQFSSKSETKDIYDWMYKDASIFSQRKYDKFQEFL